MHQEAIILHFNDFMRDFPFSEVLREQIKKVYRKRYPVFSSGNYLRIVSYP